MALGPAVVAIAAAMAAGLLLGPPPPLAGAGPGLGGGSSGRNSRVWEQTTWLRGGCEGIRAGR